MIEVVSNCIHDFFMLFKYFFSIFFGSASNLATRYLLPGIGIGIAVSVIFLAVKIIKKVVWGS